MSFPFPDKRKKLLLSTAVTAASTIGLGYVVRRLMQRPLPPQHGRFTIDSLQDAVEVIRDKWGVPHIYAQNEHDLFFVQGYIHAQDRLFQMDINRRLGLGRLSELIGPLGLASDRFARYAGWSRVSMTQLAGADVQATHMANAYIGGINAFIDANVLPVEYRVLACKPEPWQFLDLLAWGVVLAWGLSVNWETELNRLALLEAIGPEKCADLTPGYNGQYPTVLPTTQVGTRFAVAMLEAYHTAMAQLPFNYMPSGHGVGSNNWVVSGEHTESGRPILANDPHLPPIFPAFWYENHLVTEEINVTGFTMPGVPGVIIGHNNDVAWGLTNAFPDIQDIFVERFDPHDRTRYEFDGEWREAEVVVEEIKVRGRKPVQIEVRYTHHGPLISDILPDETRDLALCWAVNGRYNHMRSILEINKATDWDSFREGLRHWGFPSQNMVYADVAGNIAYKMPGDVPLRRNGDGLVPVPGWTNEHDWTGWIPFDELPQQLNPPSGMIVTANNRIHGTDYPYLLTSEWLPGYRAQRIWDLLQASKPLTLASNGRIQNDTVSLMALRFIKLALPPLADHVDENPQVRYVLNLLNRWDGDMAADAVAPTLYFGWLVHFTRACMIQAVGETLTELLLCQSLDTDFMTHPFHEAAPEVVMDWLETEVPTWAGEIRPLLLPALHKTIRVLRETYGKNTDQWRWGKIHHIKLQHPVTQIPGLGRLWKPRTLPVGGDGYTVNQADVTLHFPPAPVNIIASCRLLIDVGDWDNSLASLPGGQSGQPGSPHYQDALDDWGNGRYHPQLFSREKIETVAVGWHILTPGLR